MKFCFKLSQINTFWGNCKPFIVIGNSADPNISNVDPFAVNRCWAHPISSHWICMCNCFAKSAEIIENPLPESKRGRTIFLFILTIKKFPSANDWVIRCVLCVTMPLRRFVRSVIPVFLTERDHHWLFLLSRLAALRWETKCPIFRQ